MLVAKQNRSNKNAADKYCGEAQRDDARGVGIDAPELLVEQSLVAPVHLTYPRPEGRLKVSECS